MGAFVPEPGAQPLDIYVNMFQVTSGFYDGVVNLMRASPLLSSSETAPAPELLVSARMSLETMKLLAFFVHRQIVSHEKNLGISIAIPPAVLNAVQISPEDWQVFWGGNQ